MERTTKILLLSEWNSIHNYIERLFHALFHHTSASLSAEEFEILKNFHEDIAHYFAQGALNESSQTKLPKFENLVCLSDNIKYVRQIIDGLIRWKESEDEFVEFILEGINLFYDLAYELHWIVQERTDLEIQYPRTGLTTMNPLGKEAKILSLGERRLERSPERTEQPLDEAETNPPPPRRFGPQGLYAIDGQAGGQDQEEVSIAKDKETLEEETKVIAHFYLPIDDFFKARDLGLNIVEVVEHQRMKRYEDKIQEGHEAIFHKEHAKALEAFLKAQNYQDSAEVLTLVGWSYSLLGQLDKAKSYCLKAIQKDPEYGPPYNDMGSYLLAEGQTEESLKWFDLAKRAINYQNREYPFINAGRAYMTKKDLTKALEEFSGALSLAPYHEELHKTVEKLKKSLMKIPQTGENLPPMPPL